MKTDLVVAGYIIDNGKVLLIHHKKLDLWLPVGGHIEKNETPAQAVKREIKEETGLNVKILNISKKVLPENEVIKEQLPIPFHMDVHSVGDHNHCCLFYICKAEDSDVKIKKDEVKDYSWVGINELQKFPTTPYIKGVITKAFTILNKIKQ